MIARRARSSIPCCRVVDIVLARHAESIWNAENRWQGQTDVPLSEKGLLEARSLGARLATVEFDRRVVSDLTRTGQTAAAIGGTFTRDAAWREIALGSWSGLLHAEVAERFPEELAAMAEGRPVKLGGGESVPEFEARANAALDALIRTSGEGDRVLVVTHGGVIRAIVMQILGVQGRRVLIGAGNTSLTHLRVEGGSVRLVSYNCASHLAREEPETDEVLQATGEGGEVLQRAAAHLRLAPDAAERLLPPAEGSVTRLVHGLREKALRTFAGSSTIAFSSKRSFNGTREPSS